MFSGGFRAKLNSRSHRRASVFATVVVALHPSFLSLYPLLAIFLACVSLGTGHTLNFLATRWVLRHALSELAGVWDVDCIYIAPVEHGGKGEIVWLCNKDVGDVPLLLS